MANTKSAKKAMRHTALRFRVNRARKSRVHTFVRKAERAIAEGSQDSLTFLRDAESELMRAVVKGVMHRNTAARKISRLTLRNRARTLQTQGET